MGRLNYTNRKIEGLKLGQVVAKDLLKRIPPGTGHKAALRDPCVELDVSGKLLTDPGLWEAAKALVLAIGYGTGGDKVVRLEELCLKGNQLTVASLLSLGRIIALAAFDLKDLDLSDNLIAVTTVEDSAAWEFFLSTFSTCCVLRRVDFGGNALGPKAFEVLARVYGKEEPFDIQLTKCSDSLIDDSIKNVAGSPIAMDGAEQQMRKMSLASRSDGYRNEPGGDGLGSQKRPRPESISPQKKSPSKLGQATSQSSMLQIYKTTQGLRSVPYLILSNTAMTETCALHLSYIIASHHLPDQLLSRVPPVKAGPPAQQLETYDKSSGCQGIVYLPNSSLTIVGTKVLDLSELARIGALDDTSQQENMSDTRTNPNIASPARRSSEAAISTFHQDLVGRRRSTVSSASEEQDVPKHNIGELDRARSRIQGNTLRDVGPKCNDLWRTALKMLSVARIMLLRSTQEIPEESPWDKKDKQEPLGYIQHSYVTRISSPRSPVMPLGTADPNQSITSRVLGKRKESLVLPRLIMTPIVPQATKPSRSSLIFPKQENPYRSHLLGGLSKENWRCVIALATDSIGISSTAQQQAMLEWAMDRGTLEKEGELLGKSESAQIWKVLEGMGCLAYDIRS